MTAPTIIQAAPSTRAMAIKIDTLNEDARTIDVVFASEAPVDSWMPEIGRYAEILDCTPESCNMVRLLNGAQFLKEHDRRSIVGVVENARFENRLGIATLRFAKTALGEEEFQMAKDGIRKNFSVGFTISELTLEKASEVDGDVYRATGWEPNEISVVSVEADINCKALRSRSDDAQPVQLTIPEQMKMNPKFRKFHEADKGDNASTGAAPITIDLSAERAKLRADLLKQHQEIADAAANFKRGGFDVSDLVAKAQTEDWTVDKFRAEGLQVMTRAAATSATGSRIEVIGERSAPKSIGQIFVSNDVYNGRRGDGRKHDICVSVPDVSHFRATASTSTITNYNGITAVPGPIELGVQQATVADLMAQGTTNLNAIPFMQEDTITNAATSVAQGATKPEATFDWSQTSAPVVKIAVTAKVTDELFADVPTMQSYIDSRLRWMVENAEDTQLLTGSGGANLTGITNTVGVQTQALGLDTKSDALRKAMTKIQSVGFFQPDGIVIHPNDWEELSLSKDANGQYLAGGPFYAPYGTGGYVAFQRIWGLPVVVTTSMTEGTAIVGNFKLGSMIFRRMGITVESTNSNNDDFVKNLITIRAEERLALAVWRAKAFCLVTGI